MARGPERPWRAQKGPLLDAHILASIYRGELVETGDQPLTEEAALEIKRALYRAARRQGYSVTADVETDPATGRLQVRFRAMTKAEARAFVIAKYGPDRSKWPYNPRFQQPREDQA